MSRVSAVFWILVAVLVAVAPSFAQEADRWILTLFGQLKIFGRAVGTILYVVLGMYALLVGYELFLLRNIPLD